FVVVRDFNGLATAVGGYAMTAVSLGSGIAQNAGGDGGPVNSGQTRIGKIDVGDIDVLTIPRIKAGHFPATIGETTNGGPLTPQVVLYSPTGGLLTFNQSASGITITDNTLPATGTYFVVVRDFNGLATAVGGYAMTAVSLGAGIPQDPGLDGG